MKYFVLIFDGMADRPVPELGGLTPMQKANKPNLDNLARDGFVGTVLNVPEGMRPESDTANIAIMSYDPRVYSKGRSPLEAVSLGIEMLPDDTAIRTNVVTLSEDEPYEKKKMLDHSADEISTEDARILIEYIEEKLGTDTVKFYPGVSYRHCCIWKNADEHFPFTPPHNIIGKEIGEYLPDGDGGKKFREFMEKSYELLSQHPLNIERKKNGKNPANSIWFWSPGKKPEIPNFKEKWGLKPTVISAVDLLKGIGICAGMESIDVEGATGNIHTNYEGKAAAAIAAFESGQDYVYVHVEAPDECGHRGEIENKVTSIEYIDRRILEPVMEYLAGKGEPFKILCLPDHPTPLEIRTHSSEPVPFVMYTSEKKFSGVETLDEFTAKEKALYVENGTHLMGLMKKIDEFDTEEEALQYANSEEAAEPDRPSEKKKEKSLLLSIFETLETCLLATALVLFAFTFIAKPSQVFGASMNNTLQHGDRLILSDIFYTPKAGDIIVFQNDESSKQEPLVKRVIATENQWIDIKFLDYDRWEVRIADTEEGILTAEPIDESGYVYFADDQVITSNIKYPVQVPEGHVFVMGDNRNHSLDSRSSGIGMVPEETIIGKAIFRVYPINKIGVVK